MDVTRQRAEGRSSFSDALGRCWCVSAVGRCFVSWRRVACCAKTGANNMLRAVLLSWRPIARKHQAVRRKISILLDFLLLDSFRVWRHTSRDLCEARIEAYHSVGAERRRGLLVEAFSVWMRDCALTQVEQCFARTPRSWRAACDFGGTLGASVCGIIFGRGLVGGLNLRTKAVRRMGVGVLKGWRELVDVAIEQRWVAEFCGLPLGGEGVAVKRQCVCEGCSDNGLEAQPRLDMT